MPRLRYNVAASLDGFIASPDGSTSWIIEDPTIDFPALYSEFDYFIMGRKTYQVMQSFGADNPLSKRPKESVMVVSRTMNSDHFPDITVIQENVLDYIRHLKTNEGKDIWLMGGGNLAAQCLEAHLVDTVQVAIMPTLLGTGIPLASSLPQEIKLQLSDSTSLGSGIIMTQYKVMQSPTPTAEYAVANHRVGTNFSKEVASGGETRCGIGSYPRRLAASNICASNDLGCVAHRAEHWVYKI
ncbi:riboflavin biosynthesis domain-containing protein [Fusarium napiforme]|uniref:2,5-diamino-6-ribosylamino-4(3H)-pyrimidinone 5'-phosphate reductase n=1 Tax=Fusarium napiforme TaxID=42672 RepID=A0A8H5N661_9HYPO|nr:riboflavin biosynthesis domain-containing protein [Fusarium napiforme]